MFCGGRVTSARLQDWPPFLSKKYYVEIALETLGIHPETKKPWIKKIEHEPSHVTPGHDHALTVKGKEFNTRSRIFWNGVEQNTTLVRGNLRATVPGAKVPNSKKIGGTTGGTSFSL